MKTCFFIGHADAGMRIYDSLVAAVERHISAYGVLNFMVGRYGNFDSMAASAVHSLRSRHEGLKLTLLLPYHPAAGRSIMDDPRFDDSLYPFDGPVPYRCAIPRANRYAIDHADYLICYVRHPGKSRDYLEYARKRERKGLVHIEKI